MLAHDLNKSSWSSWWVDQPFESATNRRGQCTSESAVQFARQLVSQVATSMGTELSRELEETANLRTGRIAKRFESAGRFPRVRGSARRTRAAAEPTLDLSRAVAELQLTVVRPHDA